MSVQLRRAGDRGVMAELDPGIDATLLFSVTQALREHFAPVAAVAGHSSVLLLFDRVPQVPIGPLGLDVDAVATTAGARHTIPVSFAGEDAPDLDDVLALLAISHDEFVRRLTGMDLRVRFSGFLPGFAYLDGLPAEWNVPRRATSRTKVPAGSLGIAAGMAGFYPADSPGGWNLIGRATERFWDSSRNPPALLAPGDVVRIAPGEDHRASDFPASSREIEGIPTATCLAPGQHTLIVTLPDARRYDAGLPTGGAFDERLAARANELVGNDPRAELLECTLVGPELRFDRDCRVAWTGARVSWEINGDQHHGNEADLATGDVLRIGRLTSGVRGWLAVSGGVVSGALPFEPMAPRVVKGQRLFSSKLESDRGNASPPVGERGDRHVLAIVPGPHTMETSMLGRLLAAPWAVTPSLDRTGIRLASLGDRVTAPASIPSCGMQSGSVQLHPNGDLVVMGPDHPITGGYIQPFTTLSTELWKLAQLQPGDQVRWTLA